MGLLLLLTPSKLKAPLPQTGNRQSADMLCVATQVFGLSTLGRIQGLLFLAAALLNLLSNPVVTYTNSALGGDFTWPTLIQLAALLPLVALTEVERWYLRRGRRAAVTETSE